MSVPGCHLSATILFIVYVVDVNDNSPQFQNLDSKTGYIVFLRADASTGTVIKSISVYDADASMYFFINFRNTLVIDFTFTV